MTERKPHESVWMDLIGVPFSQGYIDANGINTRYLHAGDNSKPTLILLHGTGGHAEAYTRNLQSHAEHFDVWAIDMVGSGLSGYPDIDLEIPVYVKHLADFMDAIGAKSANISGESLGGWVAAQFAIDFPERVDRLVLNTAAGRTAFPEVMERIQDLSRAAVQDPSWERIGDRMRWLMANDEDAHDDIIATRQYIYSRPGMEKAMERNLCLQIMEIRQRNLISDQAYNTIKAPTLVLWTSDDPTADVSEGRKIAELIPGARFEVMDGCGHWPQFEDPETFTALHIGFLTGTD